MDKSAIKNYAVWARRKLIEDITQKAFEIGITQEKIEEEVEVSSDTVQVNGRLLQKHQAKQRASLIERIREKGFSEVIEEVAYTWFNRIIAIRFMEVNDYLPTGVRVLSSIEAGKAVPDIITNALHLDLNLDLDQVHRYLDIHNDDELFRYMFTRQCNKLNEILPYLFEMIEDYTELLLPNNLLIEGSVIRRLVSEISEEDFKEQVEIIGWLYQYYISEKKDAVFEALKKNVKITKENIPAATQLFTPDWIVKYMVENSLGRLWLEGHLDDALKANWKYYLEEAEQEPEVQRQLEEIREKSKILKPEEIKVLDPCMGSGHILVYAFDVLMEIYRSCGYAEREAVKLILQNNLYGMDIDDRAFQLAYFAVMMKARGYSRRILNEGISPNLCAIQETPKYTKQVIKYNIDKTTLLFDKEELKATIDYLLEVFEDAKEYGSIIIVKSMDYNKIQETLQMIIANVTYVDDLKIFLPMIKQAAILARKYDVVVTNPPYMGGSGMSTKLSEFVKKNYPDSKSDLFSVFIEKGFEFTKTNGLNSMITMQSWMFLSSFENLRKHLFSKIIVNLTHIGYNSFPEINSKVAQAVTFVFKNKTIDNYISTYLDLTNKYPQAFNKEEAFFREKTQAYYKSVDNFKKIPGMPIAYWVSERILQIYKNGKPLESISQPRQGMATSNNDIFLRLWFEVGFNRVGINNQSREQALASKLKWFPYNKGGSYRKWYGNIEYLVNWENDGFQIKEFRDYKNATLTSSMGVAGLPFIFRENITWSKVTTGKFSVRYLPEGSLFDVSGCSIFSDNNTLKKLLALLNSKVIEILISAISQTLNYEVGSIKRLPIINLEQYNCEYVEQNIAISREDWNSFETSLDYKCHPFLIHKSETLKQSFINWKEHTDKQFKQLKDNEESLNRIFIRIYCLQDELTPEVDEKDVTIRKADLERDVKNYISYAVGCMFGRYSLDEGGLAYAGGDWDSSKYKTFIPDFDNVIPITDEEYFNDDLTGRFIEFVKITFGAETLESNLDFIADALGNKGNTSREAICQYFIKDFYKGHLKTYQKKPIYWLFDSGKENGFKALIYLHRYDEFTVAKVRTDYLHKLQKMYEAEFKRLDILIDSNVSEREKTLARKKKEKLQKQMQECLAYDQVIAHVANQRIKIDLDDGVTVNYAKFQGVEIPQGEGRKPLKADLLAVI